MNQSRASRAKEVPDLFVRPRATSSLITVTPALVMAPIASSSRPGTPSLRTTNTSSGAPRAVATS